MKRILFQGDSITDSSRCLRNDDTFMGAGYAVMVSGELGCENPGKYEFLNRGVGGNRVVDLYARIKSDIINLKPDVMSVLIGVNDAWHELDGRLNGVDAEKYFNVYSLLIEEVKAANPDIQIMILEPFILKGIATENDWEYFAAEVSKRAEKSKQIAEKYNLKFIPLQKKFNEAERLAPTAYWLGDGVHPTAAGHNLIKQEWIKAFKELQEVER